MKWRVETPAPSAFDPAGPAYQVRHITVGRTGNASVKAGLAAVADEALRLAPANLDRSRSLVLFEWDPVYATLTVVFTDAKRNDATDVLKLFCKGWDSQHRKEDTDGAWEMTRLEAVRAWLDALVVRTKARWRKRFPKRAIRLAFKDHGKQRMQTLGEGKFKDPYARV